MGRPEKPPSSAYSLFRFVNQLSILFAIMTTYKNMENKEMNKKKVIKKETKNDGWSNGHIIVRCSMIII